MPQAYRGSTQVNPTFTSADEVSMRMAVYIAAGAVGTTFGIATAAVADAAGPGWVAGAAAGRARVYLRPQYKDRLRGYQANYQERDAANVLVINLHLSISCL